MMIRWMCGVTLKDRNSSEELRERLGIVSVSDIVRQGRLRWFGHVERKDTDDWVSACRNIDVEGKRGKGRGRKTWKECLAVDAEAGKCARSRCVERWHFEEPSNPCKRGQTDVKSMTMNDDRLVACGVLASCLSTALAN